MKRRIRQSKSNTAHTEDLSPHLPKLRPVGDVAGEIRGHCKTRWLDSEDLEYRSLLQSYERYLAGMGAEYSVGQGRVLLLKYDGPQISFLGAEGIGLQLDSGSILGHIVSKRTKLVDESALRESLSLRRRGFHPGEIYSKLRGRMPLSWGVVDCLPEAPLDSPAVGFLSFINTRPDLRNIGLSQKLIPQVLNKFLDESKVNYAFAFARAPGFGSKSNTVGDIQEYVLGRGSGGLHADVGIRVHQRAGGVVVCGVPDCALDSESLGNGVLMVYDLRYLRRRGRI